jgi:hypothetical protein
MATEVSSTWNVLLYLLAMYVPNRLSSLRRKLTARLKCPASRLSVFQYVSKRSYR